MCNIKNFPIYGKYQNPNFGHHADFCMVGVIRAINHEPDCATVASCCGHGGYRGSIKPDFTAYPYITVVQPKNKIKYIRDYLLDVLGWDEISISVWDELPESFVSQMSHSFCKDKVYVGYYNMADEENGSQEFCHIWSEDDLQVA